MSSASVLIDINGTVLVYNMESWEWIGIGLFGFAIFYMIVSPYFDIELLYIINSMMKV